MVHVIASSNTWIEGEAIRQLEATAAFPGMLACVGMPDLQPSKGSPSGAAFLADRVYPSLVGTDNGCGIGFWMTDMPARKLKIERIITRLDGLDAFWDGNTDEWLADRQIAPTAHDIALGTPGHGNHFIEVQRVGEIIHPGRFAVLGLSADHLCITVHSGSRRFGEAILHEYAAQHGAQGVMSDTPEGQRYLEQNAHAMAWAVANRELCAHRTLEALHATGSRILDICHNSVTAAMVDGCQCWLHRKGAAPADQGPVIIPGSRNDLSYLVQPKEREDALRSVAHGAGRKINRGDAEGKLTNLYANKDIRLNRWGGRVICGERPLLWEEAAECYKDIDTVINALVDADLITVITTLHPLVTFKTSEGAQPVRRDRKNWQRERAEARQAKRNR